MENYSIEIYQPKFKSIWDAFVSQSKNATFLFQRDFMEYHQHRFEDFSLMLFKNGILVGLLPANRAGDKLYSHQGLTYGGLLLSADIKFDTVLRSFELLLKFLSELHIQSLSIKDIPTIYHRLPSEEARYLYYILNAQLEKREVLSVIDTSQKLKFSRSRREGIKRAQKHHLRVVNDDDFKAVWNSILKPNLDTKHNVTPVHSLKEILYLKDRFPDNIKQFNVYHEGQIVAGATIFETPRVAHCQYISGNADKNTLGSLDVLHDYLINEVYAEKRYFDFGSSNENDGKNINYGLQFWKEGFGARTITQDFYIIETKNHNKLNGVLS
ncbi:GNAT family N-acetyltransferase [Gelidibacter salicanalis]|uniref:GNAT family N-acetyltransferase n=1 Tax=Gelidibacter salicanalis TaxID=291193 RepID=A0A934KK57_9FLAO|nr:GNAT family N-acetyltransferase [Gelidibacter salicanalis]MBJ7879259.1 GNAT family N-acetyltransferase [Gelidibacter salicanalis]